MNIQPYVHPTIGRIVHYVSYGTPGGEFAPEHRAAIITRVYEDSSENDVDLCVLNPTGMFFNQQVMHDANHGGGTWHWPEMVADL